MLRKLLNLKNNTLNYINIKIKKLENITYLSYYAQVQLITVLGNMYIKKVY